ncbi:MAG: alpha/beta fold hydrolase [Spirochaetia bacterium]|nr:alpha/beta fold hydrolase [Spirochaetia bacterium]
MKNVQILALSGWSFGPKSLDPVLQKIPSSFDLRVEDETSWPGQGDKKLKEWESFQGEIVLFGWSLGAFRLFPLLKLPSVKGAVFMSMAETFVKSEANPRGAGPEVLETMIRGLRDNPAETLSGFRRDCFSPESPIGFDETKEPKVPELIQGLKALAAFDLRKDPIPSGKKVVLIQGRKDRILPVFGARAMAKNRGLVYVEVEEGGHALPLTHPGIAASELTRFL